MKTSLIKQANYGDMTSSAKKTPYDKAKENRAASIEACNGAVLSAQELPVVILDEAFSFFEECIIGQGLDEEAISAAFLTSLAAASRTWSAWCSNEDALLHGISWMHFNKVSEASVGADFALLLMDTQERYRIIIIQAKRFEAPPDNTKPVLLSVKRTSKNEGVTKAQAYTVLNELLNNKKVPAAPNSGHWQLSKLLYLRAALKQTILGDIPVHYAAWPDHGGTSLEIDLQAVQDQVLENIKQNTQNATQGKKIAIQTVHIDRTRSFRNLLVSFFNNDSTNKHLDMSTAREAFNLISSMCSTTIVLDLSGKGLGSALRNDLGLTPAEAFVPTPEAGAANHP